MDRMCHFVLGTRPEIIKMAPVIDAWVRAGYGYRIVHSGQHYDFDMDEVFFQDLDLPRPDDLLNVGSVPPATQTANIIAGVARVLERDRAHLVVVQGDTNTTVGAALAAAKHDGATLAHVESGCRSFNRRMPEEANRIVTDHLSDLLFAATPRDFQNLRLEGLADRAHLVGSTGIESCLRNASKARTKSGILSRLGLKPRGFGLVTVHRTENTSEKAPLIRILTALLTVSKKIPIVFPVHPRTARQFEDFGIQCPDELVRVPPLGYLDFLALLSNAALVLTDSGGVQEEAAALGTRCFTLRDETEWTFTVEAGVNTLVGTNPSEIATAVTAFLATRRFPDAIPPPWITEDSPSKAIVEILAERIDS